ncbi:MAG: hypothetical protein IJD60_12545 [Clostridia bacterium]|nr:hypothetical protein [Clostridia bacterium]
MGRFFRALVLCAVLTPVFPSAQSGGYPAAQPVFFSMIFPQLIPDCLLCPAQREAMLL